MNYANYLKLMDWQSRYNAGLMLIVATKPYYLNYWKWLECAQANKN